MLAERYCIPNYESTHSVANYFLYKEDSCPNDLSIRIKHRFYKLYLLILMGIHTYCKNMLDLNLSKANDLTLLLKLKDFF